jgi:anti-anti-sigma factor
MAGQAQDGADRLFLAEFVDGVLTLVPLDDFDTLRWPELEEASQRVFRSVSFGPGAKVLVDMSRIHYCGSAFLGLMLRVWKSVSPANGVLAFCNVSEDVAAVLRQTRLDTLWVVYASREAAYAAMRQS